MLNAIAKIAHRERERERERVIAQICEFALFFRNEILLHFASFKLKFLDSRESCNESYAESMKCEL